MLKSAGDTTALRLMNGLLVEKVHVYGLACQYQNQSAKLIKMILNFGDNKAMIVATRDEIDIHRAVMWLLNSVAN